MWCPYLSRLNLIIIIISIILCNLFFFPSSWFLYLWAAAPFEAFRGFLAYLAVATAFSNFSARTSPRHSIGSSGGADGVYVGPLSTSCAVLTRQYCMNGVILHNDIVFGFETKTWKRGDFVNLRIDKTPPKTVVDSSKVEQFQRWKRNWLWHSLMPILAPKLIVCQINLFQKKQNTASLIYTYL